MAKLTEAQRKASAKHKLSLTYLAGIIDGEGCLTIQRSMTARSHTFKIKISMTHKKVLETIKYNFGGHLWGPYKHNGRKKEKLVWEWCVYGKEAFELLKKVKKYLIVKREEAHVAFDFCRQVFYRERHFGPTQLTEEEITDRNIWYLALKFYKRGGEYQYGNI